MTQSFIDGKRLLWLFQADSPLTRGALEGWLESMQESLQAQLELSASIAFCVHIADGHALRAAYERLCSVHAGRGVGASRMMWLICLDDEAASDFSQAEFEALARAWRRAHFSDEAAAQTLFRRLMDAVLALGSAGTYPFMQAYMAVSSQIAAVVNDMRLGEELLSTLNLQRLYQPQSFSTPGEVVKWLSEVLQTADTARKRAADDLEHTLIARVRTYVQRHLSEASLDEAARHLHINASYLSRAYSHATGETLTEFITAAKIHRAQELLRRPGVRILDVASAVGFSAPAYFSFFFKKNTGITPREYIQRMANL